MSEINILPHQVKEQLKKDIRESTFYVIYQHPDAKCKGCGEMKELRYGYCYKCVTKAEKEVKGGD